MADLIEGPGLDAARRRVRHMSEADLAVQRSLLRAAFTDGVTALHCG